MLADFLSKPLQGHLFRKFRAVLPGVAHVSSLRVPMALPGEERVIGHANDPSHDARESRSGVRGNDLGAVAPIRVALTFLIRTFLFSSPAPPLWLIATLSLF